MIIGMTSGCFDLIHIGHIRYLERCKSLCDRLIVGVDSDSLITKTKGPTRPIINEKERLELINSLSCVDSGFILKSLSDLTNIVNQFGVSKVFKSGKFISCIIIGGSSRMCQRGTRSCVTKHNIDNLESFIYGVDDTKAKLIIVPDIADLKSTSWIINKINGIKK